MMVRACVENLTVVHAAGADARLHLVTNRVGYGGEMHRQLHGDVIVYARDGRRVQL